MDVAVFLMLLFYLGRDAHAAEAATQQTAKRRGIVFDFRSASATFQNSVRFIKQYF